jgi:site-specific recombinase
MATPVDLPELLDALDPDATLVQRHLWLIGLVVWVRGDGSAVATSLSRLTLLLDALQQRPHTRELLQRWWRNLLDTVDATALLADYGFASRSAFVSEFSERMRLKLMPATPETADASALFSLVFNDAFDAQWIAALDDTLLTRLADLLQPDPPAGPVSKSQGPCATAWQTSLMEAVTFCTSQIRATGFSPELRLRMSTPAREAGPFHALSTRLEALHQAHLTCPDQASGGHHQALTHYVEQLDACRHAAASVYTHLDAHGISVNLVFQLRQLRARVLRIRALLDGGPGAAQSARAVRLQLLAGRGQGGRAQR